MPKRIGLNTEPAPTSTPVPEAKSEPQPEVKITSNSKFPIEPEILRQAGDKLSAFVAMPKHTRFQGEADDETIILLLRAHTITNVPWIIVSLFVALAPFLIFPILFMINIFPPLPAGFQFVGTIFWFLGTTTYALINFLSWYFNAYIITNERIIDVDWHSLTYCHVTTAQMSKIQDVTYTIGGGVIRSLFDFGTIHIETAGELENLEFTNVPHPALVSKQIQDLLHDEELQWETKP